MNDSGTADNRINLYRYIGYFLKWIKFTVAQHVTGTYVIKLHMSISMSWDLVWKI